MCVQACEVETSASNRMKMYIVCWKCKRETSDLWCTYVMAAGYSGLRYASVQALCYKRSAIQERGGPRSYLA
jgi:hypothetical protein